MRIIIYWAIFSLIWGPIMRVTMHDRGVFTPFWYVSSLGHLAFGALWVITCLDYRFQPWIMKKINGIRCIRALFLLAIAWECLEWLWDTYFLKPGQFPAQEGTFDTISDVGIAIIGGIVTWCFRTQARAAGLYLSGKFSDAPAPPPAA